MNRLLSVLGVVMLFGLGVVMLFGLGACTNTNSAAAGLPLSDDTPTFLFFYTDN